MYIHIWYMVLYAAVCTLASPHIMPYTSRLALPPCQLLLLAYLLAYRYSASLQQERGRSSSRRTLPPTLPPSPLCSPRTSAPIARRSGGARAHGAEAVAALLELGGRATGSGSVSGVIRLA